MTTIDEIMGLVDDALFLRLTIDQVDIRTKITQAIGEARADGAREMREAVAAEFDRRDDGAGTGFYDPHEPAEIVRSLPLPTGERQAVRLTDVEVKQIGDATLYAGGIYDRVRAIETAVLAANGLTK